MSDKTKAGKTGGPMRSTAKRPKLLLSASALSPQKWDRSVCFTHAHIKDVSSLTRKAFTKSDRVSRLLREHLHAVTVKAVKDYEAPKSSATGMETLVVHALNNIVDGPPIYDEATYPRRKLHTKSEEMLRTTPRKRSQLLNRLYVGETYPAELGNWNGPVGLMGNWVRDVG